MNTGIPETAATAKAQIEQPNNELQILIPQIHKGAFLHEASTELRKVIQGAKQSNKVAKLNLSIIVIPHGEGSVAVEGKVSVVIIKPKKLPTVFFTTEDNRLQRDDPDKQKDLPFEVVKKEPLPLAAPEKTEKPIAAAS